MSEHHVSVRSYRPGAWFGILGERAVVILPPSEKSRVAAIWELVDGGAGFDVTLDALISTGLRELPSFVLVSTAEGETKVVLRGPARAVFTVDGEEIELEGSSATTWVERSLHDVQRMSITVDDEVEPDVSYVVDGGLFRISSLQEAPASEGAPEHEPVAGSEPDVPHLRVVDPSEDSDGPAAGMSADELEIAHTEAVPDAGPLAAKQPDALDGDWVDVPDEGLEEEYEDYDVEEADESEEGDEGDEPGELDAMLAGADERSDEQPHGPPEEQPPWAGVRSPEPPAWTPPSPPPAAPAATPATTPGTDADPLSWGAPGDGPETEAMPLGVDADHDGLTRTGAWQPEPAQPPGIPGQPPAPDVTRPVARLVISNGETVEVDRAIVIGRAPEARRFSATEQPRLITVSSPNLEISATHVEVRPGSGADHGSAVVTDLGSTNGTVLIQPGLGPEDLEPGVAVQLIPGAVIDLGDGVTIQVTHP